MTDTAYRTADPEVIAAYDKYIAEAEVLQAKRNALVQKYGRTLMVNRLGFGHGTRVVGFEMYASDVRGETLHDKALMIPKRGNTVSPNLRTKAGKVLAAELGTLTSPNLDLPGMPDFHLFAEGDGIRSGGPALWVDGGIAYALWPCDTVSVGDNWESIPLSTYYLAREQFVAVSGNEEN